MDRCSQKVAVRWKSRYSSCLMGLVVLAGLVGLGLLASPSAWALPFVTGDIFAGVGGGVINEFHPNGTLYQTLNTGLHNEFDTGMAFDASGNLFATNFNADSVTKFNNNGGVLGTFGTGYNADPESIVIDSAHNLVYVGQADGTHLIKQFNSSGTLIMNFAAATQNRGTDWIDLESNGNIIHYTSEGTSVKRFDVATNTQLTDFATGLTGAAAYAHRILPDGGELVADTSDVVRLNSSGAVIKTYTIAHAQQLFALNLDPSGNTFWTGDLSNGLITEVNIATGATVIQFSSGTTGMVDGVTVFGEICTTCPPPVGVPEPGTALLLVPALVGLAAFESFRKGRPY